MTEEARPPGGRRRRRVDALTPAEIVEELDLHIIGQVAAKRALAVALRNRFRRRQLSPELRRAITPKNMLMIGPTGVGKTEMVRRVASMLEAPFLKVEATKYTEVGYVGRDVESIIHDLVEDTVVRLHDRRLADVEAKAEQRATERIVEYIVVQVSKGTLKTATGRMPIRISASGGAARAAVPNPDEGGITTEVDESSRRRIGRLLRSEKLDDAMIEIEVTPDLEGYEAYWDYGPEAELYREAPPPPRPRARSRVVSVRDAKRILAREEANKLVDFDAVVDEALERVEESGIVFIDELDKVAGHSPEVGADVSGEGVQRDLLPIVEGSVVQTRYGPVGTHHLLFIAAGSFSKSKPSDLIPELQGRFPLRVELSGLSQHDLEEILVKPQTSLCTQYQALLGTESVRLEFTPDGVTEIAHLAALVNERVENIGARRLQTILEQVLEEVSFQAPDLAGATISVDAAYVRERTASIALDEDLSRFIL
ncbi:MAG: ATP-dependent HslUV protease ATP-binding subunit HslU [Chloroflexota bacterium]|jgi:ATP-dependent HslUV protease ATP-binding subunit HslU|nr:ATP-dependent HslUV protease ATP-binding subunit HslU [Chloroflexota bacterium]